MKLIKPYTEILTKIDGVETLKKIELIGRTCYKSESKITEELNVEFNSIKFLSSASRSL